MHLLLPVPTFRDESGALDLGDCERYARGADRTWVAGFIVCSSNGQGSCMTQDERATLLDLWLQNTSAERVVMCCWSAIDHEVALARVLRLCSPHRCSKVPIRHIHTASYILTPMTAR